MSKVLGETREYNEGWQAYVNQMGRDFHNPYEANTAAHYAFERGWDSHRQLLDDAENNDLFCSEHQCEQNLVDYPDGSRYECPECQREDGEVLGRA